MNRRGFLRSAASCVALVPVGPTALAKRLTARKVDPRRWLSREEARLVAIRLKGRVKEAHFHCTAIAKRALDLQARYMTNAYHVIIHRDGRSERLR